MQKYDDAQYGKEMKKELHLLGEMAPSFSKNNGIKSA
jgi:hypothetical protein